MAPAVMSPKSIRNEKTEVEIEEFKALKNVKSDAEVSFGIEVSCRLCTNLPTQLVSTFKSDLSDIRNLVTCSICDQLLYEPWTLGCGHTYCYSVSALHAALPATRG